MPNGRVPSLMRHPLSLVGGGIAFFGFFSILAMFLIEAFLGKTNPYIGVFTYLIYPALLVLGLVLIPAGALLAAGATGDTLTGLTVAAGLLGGTITAGTHFTKAGSRAVINASPEPFSNWMASFTEDFIVLAGIWLAVNHPIIFLVMMVMFLGLIAWILPKLWRLAKRVWDGLSLPGGSPEKGMPAP